MKSFFNLKYARFSNLTELDLGKVAALYFDVNPLFP